MAALRGQHGAGAPAGSSSLRAVAAPPPGAPVTRILAQADADARRN